MRHRIPLSTLRHSGVGIAILVAALVRVAALTQKPIVGLYSDMENYDRIAQNLLHGALTPDDTFVPIGYPAFLAGIYLFAGRSLAAVAVVQTVLGVAIVFLTWLIARRAGASERLATVAALIVAVYPPLVYYGAMVLTELLAAFFWSLTTWLILEAIMRRSGRWTAAAGVSLGITTVIRSNLLVMYPLVAAVVWVTMDSDARHVRRAVVAMVACAAVPVIAVSAMNSAILGRMAGLSTNGGMNFLMEQVDVRAFHAPDATWVPLRNALFYAGTYESPVKSYDERFLYAEGMRFFLGRPDKLQHMGENLREGFGLGLQGYWPGNRALPTDPSEHTWMRSVLRLSSRAFFPAVIAPVLAITLIAAVRKTVSAPLFALLLLAASATAALAFTALVFLADPRMHVPFDASLIATLLAAAGPATRR